MKEAEKSVYKTNLISTIVDKASSVTSNGGSIRLI